MDMELLFKISVIAPAVILAITVHEVAHGYVAWRLGDDTARREGRLTLNPFAHVDPIGTILMPGFLALSGLPPFGFAKPVPVNFMRLRSPKSDMVWVAAAGPGVNLAMAIGGAILVNVLPLLSGGTLHWASEFLRWFIQINLVLAVFNMLPLPPLDGGRVAVGLLPRRAAQQLADLERFGLFIIMGLIMVPFLVNEAAGTNFNIIGAIIWPVVEFLFTAIVGLFVFVN